MKQPAQISVLKKGLGSGVRGFYVRRKGNCCAILSNKQTTLARENPRERVFKKREKPIGKRSVRNAYFLNCQPLILKRLTI